MTKYAVIQLVGKQHKVSVGDQLTVDRLKAEPGTELKISEVLLVKDGESLQVGTPLVDKATVTLKVLDHTKGDKIRVATYKAKSRYRRVKGHRQYQSVVEVSGIKA